MYLNDRVTKSYHHITGIRRRGRGDSGHVIMAIINCGDKYLWFSTMLSTLHFILRYEVPIFGWMGFWNRMSDKESSKVGISVFVMYCCIAQYPELVLRNISSGGLEVEFVIIEGMIWVITSPVDGPFPCLIFSFLFLIFTSLSNTYFVFNVWKKYESLC